MYPEYKLAVDGIREKKNKLNFTLQSILGDGVRQLHESIERQRIEMNSDWGKTRINEDESANGTNVDRLKWPTGSKGQLSLP